MPQHRKARVNDVCAFSPAQTAEEKKEEAKSYDLRAQEHYGEGFQPLEP